MISNECNHKFVFLFILLACVVILVARVLMTKSVMGGDAVYYYANLRTLVIDRDLDFSNEYDYFYNTASPYTGNRKIHRIPEKNALTARLPNKYPVGSALFLIPFFSMAHVICLSLGKLGFPVRPDGYNLIYQSLAGLGSLLYGFVGIVVIYNLGKKIFGAHVALIGSLGILSATPLIYYITMEPMMSHAISIFIVTIFISYWYETGIKRRWHQWIILGLLGGMVCIVRYQDILFLLIPMGEFLIYPIWQKINLKKYIREYILKILAYLAAVVLIMTIQLMVNKILYGNLLSTGYANESLSFWKSPKLLYTLFSTQCGLLLWAPVLIYSIIGLFIFRRSKPVPAYLFIFMLILQWYLISSSSFVSQGDSFGNRKLVNCSPIFAIGLMQFLNSVYHRSRRCFKYVGISIGVLIIANLTLISLYCLRIVGNPY